MRLRGISGSISGTASPIARVVVGVLVACGVEGCWGFDCRVLCCISVVAERKL